MWLDASGWATKNKPGYKMWLDASGWATTNKLGYKTSIKSKRIAEITLK